MSNTERFFVECVKRGIKGEKIEFVPDGLDYQQLYNLCAAHSMSVVVLRALQEVKDKLHHGFLSVLENAAYRHLVYDVQSERDVNTLLSAFEERGLRYMPLKGYHLKRLYPSSDMRYASDFDILIDFDQLKEIRALLKELGIQTLRRDEHHDIVYHPESKTVFELHKTMFVGPLESYFGVRERGFDAARVRVGHWFFYEMDKEKFYISLLAHSAHHFASSAGVGIRHLTDIYLYRRAYRLDEAYLDAELEKCGLKKFKNELERAAAFLLDDVAADAFTERLAEHILESSVLANCEKKAATDLVTTGASSHKKAQKKALWNKIFLPIEQMKFQFPILKRAIWLLPLFYPVRWIKVLFFRPKAIGQLKEFSAVSADEVAYMRDLLCGLGIEHL